MDLSNISSIVALLSALSIASERLVEIVKTAIAFLNNKNSKPELEGRRQSLLHILALFAGLTTTYLASYSESIQKVIPHGPAWIVIGLLASGGSGFWNSIQTYVSKAKDLKAADVAKQLH